MRNKIAYAKLLLALFRISRNPRHTDSVFVIGESLYRMGASELALRKFDSSPEIHEVIANRKLLAPFNLYDLQKLPPNSLGRAYADHMLSLQLDPDFYRHMEIKNDTAFILMRLRQTHDLWHVITGFDTSVLGEVGLQGFMAAQTSLPTSFILLAGGLFQSSVKHPEMTEQFMENIIRGWQLGKRSKNIFALDWEAHWHTPLEELRKQYQVV